MGIYEFKPSDAFAFANMLGINTDLKGDELHLRNCPYCHGASHGDKFTFSINLRTGQFNCLRASCGVAGNMITLSRDFDFSLGNEVDEYYRPKRIFRSFKKSDAPIVPKEPAIAYLESRKIPEEIARKYEITTQAAHDNILVFPFYDEKGILQFIKYRKTDFDKSKDRNKEWCEANCKPILFGMKQCNDEFGRLIITEGQIDSLSVAAAGIENAVSVPTGAKGFTWVPYCYDWVSKFKEIVVFGDYEKESITLLKDMAKRFPCTIKQVRYEDYKSCKDANEILRKYGAQAVADAINKAEPMAIDRVIPLASVKDVNIYELPKLRTGIAELDRTLYGGLPFGMVCIIAGKRGDGKSTLASQIMAYALEYGYKTFAYSGELPNYLYKNWLDFQIAGRHHIVENQNDFGNLNRFIANTNQGLINAWYMERAYIYDNQIIENDEKEDLLKSIERAIQQYGIKVVLIDNLMTAMYIDEQKGSDKYDQQGRFVKDLTKLAIKYECLILLVAHQRKNSFATDVNDEISGSGDITNLAGIVLSYNRGNAKEIESGDMDESQRKLIIAKNRLFGKINLKGIILSYDERSKRLYGQDDDLDYEFSWNESADGFVELDGEQIDLPF